MKNIKSFTRTSRELVETELVKTGVLKDGQLTLYDEKGDRLLQQKAMRRHEFNKAGNLYLSDVVKYICTHEPAFLDETVTRYSIRLTWPAFVKRAIGDNQDQYYRLVNEILRTKRNKEDCYIPKADGGYYLMQPFVIDFESEDHSKLTEKELRDLKNLGREKLGHITILFAKPLFRKYLKEGGQFYQHPTCLYSQVHKYIQQWDGGVKESAVTPVLEEGTVSASDQMESAVVDAIDFFYKHGAGDAKKSQITVHLVNLLRSCYPSALNHKGNKYYPIATIVSAFLNAVVSVISKLNGLDYNITEIQDGKGEDIVVKLSHPKRLKTVSD